MHSHVRLRAAYLMVIVFVLWTSPALAQTPYLVKDINPGAGRYHDGDASDLTAAGGLLFLKGCDAYHGCELWKSDGTAEGTSLVKDVDPGSGNGLGARFSYPGPHITSVGASVFFVADDGTPFFGPGLWKSDGTEAGTMQLTRDSGLRDTELVSVGTTLFFVSYKELWKSDGTAAGTVPLKNIDVGPSYARLSGLTAVGGLLFFFAPDGALWRSDGTEAGTVMILDPGPGPGLILPGRQASVGGTFFFGATDGIHGFELWKSDGTAAGTAMVRDILPGSAGGLIGSLTAVGGSLFFVADDGVHGGELWRSDGTEAGTVLVKDVRPGLASSEPQWLTSVGGTLFYDADDGTHGPELWKSDGTPAGTVMVRDLNPGPDGSGPSWLADVNGKLFFVGWDGGARGGLFRSDGTESGTLMLKTMPQELDYFYGLTNVAGTLFFEGSGGTVGGQIWKSDGSAPGTVLVDDIALAPMGSLIQSITDVSGTLFFLADDGTSPGLWSSDGTRPGTSLIKEVSYQPYMARITRANGRLFFVGSDAAHGVEVWKSDGTAAGTTVLKDIVPGPLGSYPADLTSSNGRLFFVRDVPSATDLWQNDGTETGTSIVRSFYRDEDSNQVPNTLTDVNGVLFFVADDGTHGPELWKSDGTPAGTVMVKDIYPGALGSFRGMSANLTNVNGVLFFVADDGTHGPQLWKSDGTPAGTVMVEAIAPYSPPTSLTNVNGILFFSASGGLWRSDGSEAGTSLVKSFGGSGSPWLLTNVNGVVYFVVDDGMHGTEVWRSDGTEAGTGLLKDVNPAGSGGFADSPLNLTNVNGTLYFTANDGVHGRELWTSDGTEARTVIAADLNPGVVDSSPGALTATTSGLYFVADDGRTGRELWALTPLEFTNDDGLVIVRPGQPLTYRIAARNVGGPGVTAAAVTSFFPPAFQAVTWSCAATGGAVCASAGAGDIDDTVDMPGGSGVIYLASGVVSPTATGTLSSTATLTLPGATEGKTVADIDVLDGGRDYFTVDPCRLVDTRTPGAAFGGPAVPAGETRVFTAPGRCGIPATAKAIAVNVTALRSGAGGHVRIFPTGQALPTVATVNYQTGQVRGNNTIVTLNASGEFSAYVAQASGTTVDLIVDVTGYFK